MPLTQEQAEAFVLLGTRPLTPLHGARIFRTPTTKGGGDVPMELAVPSFSCVGGKSYPFSLFNSQLRKNTTTDLSSKYLELITISALVFG